MVGDFDIRKVCRNRVNYLREAVDLVSFNYPDIEVVDSGTELGPCIYRTLFAVAVNNTEDYRAVALAVIRINELVRDVSARLSAYRWEVFEKESYVEGNRVYMEVRWLKKIHLPGRRYTSAMDIYELAFPYIKAERGEGADPPKVILAEVQ